MAEAREDYKHIAWIDLETTGSEERLENIIEVGLVITDATPRLPIREQRTWVVYPSEPTKLLKMDPVVIDMHSKSGLLADVLKSKGGPNISMVDETVREVLTPYLTRGRIALGGSGVSHFDRKFIARFMPKTAEVLTFWAYDVGAVRRYLRLAGKKIVSPGLTHRALEDVIAHVKEARKYLQMFYIFAESSKENDVWSREGGGLVSESGDTENPPPDEPSGGSEASSSSPTTAITVNNGI